MITFDYTHWVEPNKTLSQLLGGDARSLCIFALASVLIVATVLLNCFIALAVVIDKSMKNYTNIQFAAMSCADLLVGKEETLKCHDCLTRVLKIKQ